MRNRILGAPGALLLAVTSMGGNCGEPDPTCEAGDLACICDEDPSAAGCFCFLNPDDASCGGGGDSCADDPSLCETGVELFALRGAGTVTFTGEEATGFSGTTEVVDIVIDETGVLGEFGDLLCQFVYPATGTPYALTQAGVDSDNQAVNVTCEGCSFGFTLEHATPTTARGGIEDGAYCDIWGYPAEWDAGFQDWVFAFHPSYDDASTPEADPAPAILRFYDGSGDYTYDPEGNGNYIEYAAQWFASGSGEFTEADNSFYWFNPIGAYAVWELAYYQ